MPAKINYKLNGGHWAPKDEVKEAFYTDLYHFVNDNYETDLRKMPLEDFVEAEPYIIGNLVGKYYLHEEVGGKLEDQPTTHFIGYCYHNHKYTLLIPQLIEFFALWRITEGCMEEHADDFFANAWASLVDTAKYFKYTTIEDLENSPESPTVRVEGILDMLGNCPGTYNPPVEVDLNKEQRLAKPKRVGYKFEGWYDNPEFKGKPVRYVAGKTKKDVTYYALWSTNTFFHSNDGYVTFDELYSDFLDDFSKVVGEVVTKDVERTKEHGPVSDFCKASYRFEQSINQFFSIKKQHDKWWWLIEYIRSVKKEGDPSLNLLRFENNEFVLPAQVRWELNSLFVGRFHLSWPKTSDYSGTGIKKQLADSTNSLIKNIRYLVGQKVPFPTFTRDGYEFLGWFEDSEGTGEPIEEITDDKYASTTLYAKWKKL